MSTTIPFGSSCSAMKAARTTKVAPCNSCAGPNTAPRNECAIMIWSDTSTANTRTSRFSASRRIADQRAARVVRGRQQRGDPPRQLGKIDGRRQEEGERRVVEQRERSGEPAPMRPARTVRGRDLPDLACDEAQPPAVKGFAERHRNLPGALPAQFHHRPLLARECERRGEAFGIGARMEDEIAVARRLLGCCKARAERPCDR